MITKLIAVKDRAIDAFMQPFHAQALGQAIRSFADEINNTQSEMAKHPEDYDLYYLGDFDNIKGQFTNLPEPQQIAIGKNVKIQNEFGQNLSDRNTNYNPKGH